MVGAVAPISSFHSHSMHITPRPLQEEQCPAPLLIPATRRKRRDRSDLARGAFPFSQGKECLAPLQHWSDPLTTAAGRNLWNPACWFLEGDGEVST